MAVPAKALQAAKAVKSRRPPKTPAKPKVSVGSAQQIREATDDEGNADTRNRRQRGQDELQFGRSFKNRPAAKEQRAVRGRARQRVIQKVTSTEIGGLSVDDGAGVLLGFLTWVVVLNYIQGGPQQVRNLLRAKFFNQSPDKKELP